MVERARVVASRTIAVDGNAESRSGLLITTLLFLDQGAPEESRHLMYLDIVSAVFFILFAVVIVLLASPMRTYRRSPFQRQ